MSVLLTPVELAQRWRMDVRTLSNWRVKGRGPAFLKMGEGRNTKVLYRQEDVVAYEAKHLKEAR
jgi:hypothetical protein